MGSSISWIPLFLFGVSMAFTWALIVAARKSFFLWCLD